MSGAEFSHALCRAFAANGLAEPTAAQSNAFFALFSLLREQGALMNLTAVKEMHDVILRHFVDTALAAPYFPPGARVCDVGAGGGFPTLPLAILREDLRILAVDSTAKRMAFVKAAAAALSLPNVSVKAARAEELGKNPLFREQFDCVCARAVSRLNILCELCLPLCRTGGMFLALKGAKAAQEWQEAEKGAALLGGALQRDVPLALINDTLPADDKDASAERHVLCIAKTKTTPAQYPRAYSAVCKRPL